MKTAAINRALNIPIGRQPTLAQLQTLSTHPDKRVVRRAAKAITQKRYKPF
jgi:hypothetical protein